MRRNTLLFAAALIALGAVFSIGRGDLEGHKGIAAERWFVIRIEGKAVGYLHALRKPSGDASAPILFEHEHLIDSIDDQRWLSMQTYCEDNYYYYPARATAKIREPGKESVMITVLVEKKIPYGCSKSKMPVLYRIGDKEHTLNKSLPKHAVTEFTLLEIIPRLPFAKGIVFEFNYLDMDKLKVRKKHKMIYLGLDKLAIKGRELMLHKFEQKGAGIKKIHYWLDDNHQLLRVLKGKKEELLLSDRDEARRHFLSW